MTTDTLELSVAELQSRGWILVEDGNHGEYRPRTEEFGHGEWAFIRAADMDGGSVLFGQAQRINDKARQRIRKGVGAPGDVLLSHKGTVGKVAYVDDDAPPFVCSPQTTFWRSTDLRRIDRRYLYAFLSSREFQQQLDARKGETDMAPYVSLTAQRQLLLTLPDIAQQRAIGELLGALDDKIALNRRMNHTLEATAAALFRSWFVDFDPVVAKAEGRRGLGVSDTVISLMPPNLIDSPTGVIPSGWHIQTLGEHTSFSNSKRVPIASSERIQRRGPFPYHGAAGVVDHIDAFIFDGVYLLVGEDGSVTRDDGTAVTQYVWGKFWVNNHAHVCQGKGAVSTEHLYLHFQFEPVSPFVTGAVQPKLSQGRLKTMPFLFPGDPVCQAFAELVQPLFARMRASADESRTLAALRDTLLPQLLSGAIRLRDAERAVCAAV